MQPGNALRAHTRRCGTVLRRALPGQQLLAKRKRTAGQKLKPVRYPRAKTRVAVRAITREVTKVLRIAKPNIIAQVVAAATRVTKDRPDQALVDEVMASIDFSDFDALPKRLQDLLRDVYADAGGLALDHVEVAVRAARQTEDLPDSAFDQVNERAVAYAEVRSAEMVGMRYVDGELVPNPNAEWTITDTTREGIRGYVSAVVEGRASVTELPGLLEEAYDFSTERAAMIARTEVHMANGQGSLQGWKASGVIELKVWLTAGDDAVSEDCQENEDAGPIALDAAFPSGDDAEPAHPNCRCAIAPFVDWGSSSDESESS